ncbi:MAG: hypothetical protein MJ244_01405 [Clostridia bacterium]|nr:hypothetical protein [Clostridia bacterium]
MRKLELYNTTLNRINELQKQLGTQKEKFLDGQSDYLMRINDRMTKLRNDEDSKRGFKERMSAAFTLMFDAKDKKASAVVCEMNELLRRTQTYLNIIHEIEISESKMETLIGQAEILEAQALEQEKNSYVNTLSYLSSMTIEQKMNQLIVADNTSTLANLTVDKQKLFMECLAYTKDLLKQPTDKLLNEVAKDMYECIKEQEVMEEDEPIKMISPLVLNSLAMVLMSFNKDQVDGDNELDAPCYYAEVFGQTGWNREYAMNEYVDINGIIDQGMPIEQVIITEIANRIETLNTSYDVAASYMLSMNEDEIKDLFLMNEMDYKKKYDTTLDLTKLKKYVTYNNAMQQAKKETINENIDEAIKDVAASSEEEMESMA